MVWEDDGMVCKDDGMVREDDGMVCEDDGMVWEGEGMVLKVDGMVWVDNGMVWEGDVNWKVMIWWGEVMKRCRIYELQVWLYWKKKFGLKHKNMLLWVTRTTANLLV